MKPEHREKRSSAEWRLITSRGPMVRRIPPPEHSHTSQNSETGEDHLAQWTTGAKQTKRRLYD